MKASKTKRTLKLTTVFLREQLREPISLLWTLISPSALFYFMTYNQIAFNSGSEAYLQATAGFYAYVACTVAFFGVAYYIIGRRESGFIRSFIYTPEAKVIFLTSHLTCYFITATIYCISFYAITKPSFGPYDPTELHNILTKFLICFIIFCSPALFLANQKLKFQTASTVISVTIFLMILLALLSSKTHSPTLATANSINIFLLSKNIMTETSPPALLSAISILTLTIMIYLTSKKLKINPVWSRY